ncbi:MAG: hypothetical protein JWO60_1685 [Frankiales bacterium]|nr:hypothetical protein [Frankiales bacterium]
MHGACRDTAAGGEDHRVTPSRRSTSVRRVLALAAATAVLLAGGAHASTAPGAPGATDPASALQVGADAYEYGLPLLEFLRVRREMTSVRCPDEQGNAPVNLFSHVSRFPDAAFRTVVAPNTDTLYSIAHLDLAKGPLLLRHPDMGSRYYSFAMLDPYTNVIATPGAREDGSRAGAVVVRLAGQDVTRAPRGARVVTSPARRVWVIGRTLAGDARDQRVAHGLMERYRLTTLDGRAPAVPAGCVPGRPRTFPTPKDGPGFVAALNAALRRNPPPVRDSSLLSRLRPYGIGAGLSPERAGLDPVTVAALYRGVATRAATLPTEAKAPALAGAAQHDGWYTPPSDIGDYGTDYRFRAMIALLGLGANTPDEATYPAGVTAGNGVLYDGSRSYRLTFPKGQEPPARYFWSLTMYDADGYLVDNDADRYSLGPSHPPLVRRPDGSVVIEVRHTRPTEPGVNWLPSPAQGGFRLNLRLYGPSPAALDGRWAPPPVQDLGPRVAAPGGPSA